MEQAPDNIGNELQKSWSDIINKFEIQYFLISEGLTTNRSIILADFFFWKAFEDFKVVYSLLTHGHVTQAACVACSLLEYSLHANLLLKDDEFNREFEEKVLSDEMELFGMKKMADRLNNPDLYGVYKWLCKSKHPTFEVAHFDSIRKSERHQNSLTNTQDYAWRTYIMTICASFLFRTLMELENKKPEGALVTSKKEIFSIIDQEIAKSEDKLPYDLSRTKFAKQFMAMQKNNARRESTP